MEIGLLGLDGSPGSGNGFSSVSVDGEGSKLKWASINEGFKQERSGLCGDSCRVSKMAKTDADFLPDSTALVLENNGGFLDKSSSDADKLRFFCHSKPENSAFSYLHHMAAAHTKNAGYYYFGGLSASSGMYLLSGVRGPFTQSQWLELEQQALIYKYMKENEPIPLHLLIPIIKAFESAGLFGYNGGTFRPASWGMGPFHLGYSTSTDPEPGRCRRTDGKKWRCARDAVACQKYCERHMNRGRHRSRKHVEGQQPNGNGHSVSKTDNSSTTTNLIPPSVLHGNNNKSPSFDINHHSNNQYQMNPFFNRMLVDGEKSDQGLQQANWSESSFSTSKYQTPCGELSLNGFGVPSQLSTLSPMGAVDFMSSNSVPSDNLDMGLGVGLKGESHKQANWSPISYGPLGEALQSSTGENRKTSSGLNMLPKGWEFGMRNCQPSSSSPSGVLQKGALGSLSISSAGSSPRADNNKMI